MAAHRKRCTSARFPPLAIAVATVAVTALTALLVSLLVFSNVHDGSRRQTLIWKEGPQQQSFPTAKRVLVMGLPRCASLSIHNFFKCHGHISRHYCCHDDESSIQPTSFPCSPVEKESEKSSSELPTSCGACVFNKIKLLADEAALTNMTRSYYDVFEDCKFTSTGKKIQVYSQFDVETGNPFSWFLPQHFALPLLHGSDAYAPTIWILNRRASAEIWADSVLHWYSLTVRLFNAFDIPYHRYSDDTINNNNNGNNDNDDDGDGNGRIIDGVVATTRTSVSMGLAEEFSQGHMYRALQESVDRAADPAQHARRRKELISIYENHLNRIRQYVARQQPPRQIELIEINVDDPSAGDKLASALGMDDITIKNKKDCWGFDADSFDNDWKNFSFPF